MSSLSPPLELIVTGSEPHVSNSSNPASNENSDKEGKQCALLPPSHHLHLDYYITTPVEDTTVKQSARAAPVRPKFSSHLRSDGESEGESFYGTSDFALRD